jgi:hypothetical protein
MRSCAREGFHVLKWDCREAKRQCRVDLGERSKKLALVTGELMDRPHIRAPFPPLKAPIRPYEAYEAL